MRLQIFQVMVRYGNIFQSILPRSHPCYKSNPRMYSRFGIYIGYALPDFKINSIFQNIEIVIFVEISSQDISFSLNKNSPTLPASSQRVTVDVYLWSMSKWTLKTGIEEHVLLLVTSFSPSELLRKIEGIYAKWPWPSFFMMTLGVLPGTLS